MPLVAALLLLEPPPPSGHSVYLMPPTYLQNWMRWACHQTVSPSEMERVKRALQLAANSYQLDIEGDEYTDPGPVDNRELSLPRHPLLLRPEVRIGEVQSPFLKALGRQRSQSFDNVLTNGHGNDSANNENKEDARKLQCCAVPERFYEVCAL